MKVINEASTACIHPLWLRFSHWINVFAIIIMVLSGLRIYNASPLFEFVFPEGITLGGWLGGALQWHFAMMWVFIINGLIYLILGLFTGHFSRKLRPLSIKQLVIEISLAFTGKLRHTNFGQYNMVQKMAYIIVICDGVILVMSGLVVWKSVQFPLLRELFGGYDAARLIHFIGMSIVVLFVCIHVLMVLLVPRTLMLMLRGR
ncbi:cytochrome b/b6 domain-containing protein [Salmonella enterica]|nr:cytochrome b [Salmonella enterica]EDS7866689.1 cytochrome b [Salmonella enterica subsp. enterica serovar Oslo]EFR2895238.1 cytochrome b [Salmonella enterica]EIA0033079.1 cytochrome b/b6 domain-containing protein [Salmonella enterica]EJC8595612.1 cytochrome b/b6 domain-containing protein [Salmonella enterica]